MTTPLVFALPIDRSHELLTFLFTCEEWLNICETTVL